MYGTKTLRSYKCTRQKIREADWKEWLGYRYEEEDLGLEIEFRGSFSSISSIGKSWKAYYFGEE
jgi:hypothetical protein